MLVTSRALWTLEGFRPTLTLRVPCASPHGIHTRVSLASATASCRAAGHKEANARKYGHLLVRAGKRTNARSCRLQGRRLVTCAEEALEGKTIVLLSGGVESTTLLYSMHQQAEAAGGEVLALFSDYGQRGGEQERQASRAACLNLGIELVELQGGEVCRYKAFAAACRTRCDRSPPSESAEFSVHIAKESHGRE